MAAPTIVSSGSVNTVEIANGQVGRPIPFSSWASIRVALRVRGADPGAGTWPGIFVFGLTSGATYPLDASCTHFVGTYRGADGATWERTSYTLYDSGSTAQWKKKVGSTLTSLASTSFARTNFPFTGTEFAVIALEWTRINATTIRVRQFGRTQNNPGYDVTKANFQIWLESPTVDLSGHAWSATADLSVNEGNDGVFDHIYVGWTPSAYAIYVSNFMVTRLG